MQVIVAVRQCLTDFIVGLVGQPQSQPVIFYPLAPVLVQCLFACCPVTLAAINLQLFVYAEVKILVQKTLCCRRALGHALAVNVENFEGRPGVVTTQMIIQGGAIAIEIVDVGLQQIGARRVQRIQILGKDLRGEIVINIGGLVVMATDIASGQTADLSLLFSRREQAGGGCAILDIGRDGKRCQHSDNACQQNHQHAMA